MKKNLIFGIMTIITLFFSTVTPIQATDNKPDIFAEAGIIMDAVTGQVIYEKNLHKELYPASITKLMTALISIEALKPEDTVTFSATAINGVVADSSRIGIRTGETITVNDALHGLLLMSANEVANGLAEKSSGSINSFVNEMNQRALQLGAVNTHFVNPHGLFNSTHYSTVYDMALITQELIKNDYFLSIMQDSTYQIPPTNKEKEIRYLSQQHKMLNTKKDLRIFRDDVIAGKIGYTKESNHTLVTVAKQGNRVLIAVIMNTNAQNLYNDTNQLFDYGFDSYTTLNINVADFIQTIPLYDNDTIIGEAGISIGAPVNISVPIATKKSEITFNHIVPNTDKMMSLGSPYGYVSLMIGNHVIASIDTVITDLNYFDIPKEMGDNEKPLPSDDKKSITLHGPLLGLVFFFTIFKSLPIKNKSKNSRRYKRRPDKY